MQSFLKFKILRAGISWLLNLKDNADILCMKRALMILLAHLFLDMMSLLHHHLLVLGR